MGLRSWQQAQILHTGFIPGGWPARLCPALLDPDRAGVRRCTRTSAFDIYRASVRRFVPGLSQVSRALQGSWGEPSAPVYVGELAFTSASVRRCVPVGLSAVERTAGAGAAALPAPPAVAALAGVVLAPLLAPPASPPAGALCSRDACRSRRCARLSTCAQGPSCAVMPVHMPRHAVVQSQLPTNRAICLCST